MTFKIQERSFERLNLRDLVLIRDRSLEKLETVLARSPIAGLYKDRLILLALCQGAAQHWVDGANGVKDIDVWAFFRAGLDKPFPARVVWNADLGPTRLGRHPDDRGFSGRRIDLIGRSIPLPSGYTATLALTDWLRSGSKSAQHLRRYPVIGLAPTDHLGSVLWTPPTLIGAA